VKHLVQHIAQTLERYKKETQISDSEERSELPSLQFVW
jgi:hypothetical protein